MKSVMEKFNRQQQRLIQVNEAQKAKFTIAARSGGQEIKRQKSAGPSSLGSEMEGAPLSLIFIADAKPRPPLLYVNLR